MSSLPLQGKAALVTGASSGIGRAIALRLSRDGALVALHYGRSRSAAEELARYIEGNGGAAFPIQADLEQTASISVLFDRLDAELIRRTGTNALDILVNNAGVLTRARLEDVTLADLDRILQVNLKAPFLIIQQASGRLRSGGRIINVSSMATRSAFPDMAAYSPSKAGLESLTLLLASHLGARGITVNAVLPGATATPMNTRASDPEISKQIASAVALGRVGHPSDIADVIAFLASEDARWITGERIQVSGGQNI
jgi:NAD(P)-dependent dehydrogenase (short-subunit alcohol dehydrogenase family)